MSCDWSGVSIKQLLDCVPDEMGHLKGLYDRGGHWPVELLCDCLGPGPWVLLLSMLTCLLEPVDYQSVNLSASGAMAKRILDEFFAEHGYNPNPAWLVKRLIANGEDCVVPEEDRVEGAEEEVGKSEDDSSGNKAQAECKRDGQTLEQHARTAAETQEENKNHQRTADNTPEAKRKKLGCHSGHEACPEKSTSSLVDPHLTAATQVAKWAYRLPLHSAAGIEDSLVQCEGSTIKILLLQRSINYSGN